MTNWRGEGGREEAKHTECGTWRKTCASTPNWIKGMSRGAPFRDASLLMRCKAHEAGDKTSQSSYFPTDTYSPHTTHAQSYTLPHMNTQQRPPSQSQGRLPFSVISIDRLLRVCSVFYQMFADHIPCKIDADILPGAPLHWSILKPSYSHCRET